MSKKRKNVESVVQVFIFLHFEIANGHFHWKSITHVMLYIQYYIKTVHFWLKYNGLAIMRKTTKLIEGCLRRVQDYRHICYYFYVFYVFYVFFKIQKVVTFYVFCRVSYVFSNYGCGLIGAFANTAVCFLMSPWTI